MIPKFIFFSVFTILIGKSLSATDKVICYYASWAMSRPGNGKFAPEDIDANLCTHVNYAFIGLKYDGTLVILDEEIDINQEGFKRVSALKGVNPNLKVLFSLGGAAASPGVFATVAGDPQKRQILVQNALDLLETYNYDGLDVDWEYPSGGDLKTFVDLLADLKTAFEPKGHIVTIAVNSIPGEVGGYDIPGLSNVADVINVMTYDFHNYMGGVTAENSPLYGGVNESNWQKENRNSDAAIRQWLDGGADSQKLALGIAFYGRTFILSNPSNHGIDAPISGPGEPGEYTQNLGTLGYSEVCEFHPQGTVVFLDDMKVPYLYDDSFWIGYDNEESVAYKVQYAKEQNLAGVFIWSIETDDLHEFCGQKNGLLKAINAAVQN